MLRKIRIVLACLFFAALTLMFLDFTGVLHHYLGWMAKVQFLPAVLALNVGVVVAVLVVTLLVGRVYCSVVCPLGVMQDLFSWIGGKCKKNRFHYSPARTVLRIVALVVFVLLMVLGLNAVALLVAPYSAYGRVATNLFQPLYLWLNNLCAYVAERAGSYAFYRVDVWVKSVAVLVVAAITFVGIGFLSFRWGRLWCNTICPVGTVLGFFSRYALFRPTIDTNKCNGCTLCARNCKSQCIDPQSHTIDGSRCVACMDCLDNCHQHAIRLRWNPLGRKKAHQETVDSSRRKFVATAAAVGTAMALQAQEKKVDGGVAVLADKQLPNRQVPVHPFGSVSAKNMASRCTACQLCVSHCPQQVLRPSTSLSTLMQPEMVFDRGYCKPDCTMCSQVCPAGAIRPITPAEKSAISVGHAVVVPQNCLQAQGVMCNACQRHCPAEAISLVENAEAGTRAIAVNEQRCIGCGACEYYCPVRPFSAIYVEGREAHTAV